MAVEHSATGGAIQSRHLSVAALDEYRTAFAHHPARLVVVREFLERDLACKLSHFLTREAEYYTEYGVYSVDDAVDEAAFEAADETDRFFRMNKLAETKPEFRMSLNALAYLKFRSTLGQPAFISFFETISRQPLRSTDDVGVHSMGVGDFLRPHSDANKDRQLAFVIYLSEDWSPEFGGLLEVLDRDGSITRVVPEFNSVVAFDVLAESQHLITPINDEADTSTRVTIGGWYSKV
jgi:Rps23 Pro-64 3,4-dihydroxylase Tpa1-like proline 4-hydroxylase